MRKCWILFITIVFTACINEDIEFRDLSNKSEINIFLVKEGQLQIHDSNIDLESLELENTPWVKNSEIELYDWSAHAFFSMLKKKKINIQEDILLLPQIRSVYLQVFSSQCICLLFQ